MALSFCSNWDLMDYSTPFLDPHSELSEALLGLYDPVDIPIDSLFDPPSDGLLLSYFPEQKTTPSLLPSFSDPSIFSPINDLDCYCQCPKRLKSCNDLDDYSASMMSSWPCVEFAVTPRFNGEETKKDSESGDRVLSAQSIAARERRKRISEKTQELGKLIPGGNRMNTAEMFQAAFKYVKFLQAQVGILSLMGSTQDGEGSMDVTGDIEVLLKSQVVQEKLSGEGKCIVPKEMVEALAKDTEIRSSPFISRDLNRFAGELNGSK
ncbi:transcription factor bHLH53-like [Asparagus officinalis]|uniref:transcription factor bHLH53-like n=1 Tax=Asparagus officinalis TaxID=4686 RepID=UPI00098E6DA1|nr:transcription factor bHLH53-like [Asparagus officinalis]